MQQAEAKTARLLDQVFDVLETINELTEYDLDVETRSNDTFVVVCHENCKRTPDIDTLAEVLAYLRGLHSGLMTAKKAVEEPASDEGAEPAQCRQAAEKAAFVKVAAAVENLIDILKQQ